MSSYTRAYRQMAKHFTYEPCGDCGRTFETGSMTWDVAIRSDQAVKFCKDCAAAMIAAHDEYRYGTWQQEQYLMECERMEY